MDKYPCTEPLATSQSQNHFCLMCAKMLILQFLPNEINNCQKINGAEKKEECYLSAQEI